MLWAWHGPPHMYLLGILDTSNRKPFWSRLDKRRIYWKNTWVYILEVQRSSWDLGKLQPKIEKHQNTHHLFLCVCLCISFIPFYCTCTQEGSTLLSEIQTLLGKVLLGWPSGSDSILINCGQRAVPMAPHGWSIAEKEPFLKEKGHYSQKNVQVLGSHRKAILPSLKYYRLGPVKASLRLVM